MFKVFHRYHRFHRLAAVATASTNTAANHSVQPTKGRCAIEMTYLLSSFFVALVCLGSSVGQSAEPLTVEYAWHTIPKLETNWSMRPGKTARPDFQKQIQSPKINDRLQILQAFMNDPDHQDFDRETIIRSVAQRLEKNEETSLEVRDEMIAVLCEVADATYADRVYAAAKDRLEIQAILERACARWKSHKFDDVWRQRLKDKVCSTQELLLAVRGLSETGSEQDIPLLSDILLDRANQSAARYAASLAIGKLSKSSTWELAQKVDKQEDPFHDMHALNVLGQHVSPEILAFVRQVANKGTPLAQRWAYERMCNLDKEEAFAQAEKFSRHANSDVRMLALKQLEHSKEPSVYPVIAERLGDTHPQVRDSARLQLLQRTERSDADKVSVLELIDRGLGKEEWEIVEQSLRLATELNLKQHALRIIKLLDHPRHEICITAAWSLRYLGTEETVLKLMLEHAEKWTAGIESLPKSPEVSEVTLRRLAHLFEGFGIQRYKPAEKTLVKYIPKNDQRMGLITRIAGLWALGKLLENEKNPAIEKPMTVVMSDKASMFPEPDVVRYAAALGLGWIANPASHDTIKAYNEDKPAPMAYAIEWALSRTKEK